MIDNKTDFSGSNCLDTNIKLFDEDRDFVLAMDYKLGAGNTNGAVLAQCFEMNGMNGFKVWNSSGAKITWGIESANGVSTGTREMVVIRHIKGDNGLHVYTSNIYGNSSSYVKIDRTRSTKTDATLVFGCAKADDGAYENYANGTVYWSKLWYADLGDDACKQLVAWTHEDIVFEVASFKNYYLSDGSNKRCSIAFMQKGVLGSKKALGPSTSNAGGWAQTTLREYLDARLPSALPIGWQQLIKQVKVSSSSGSQSKEITTSDCYFFVPSAIEVSSSMSSEPYIYEGQTISFMTDNASRIKKNAAGLATGYWTRSPNASYLGYFYAVMDTGELYGFYYPSDENSIATMFCI